MLTQVRIKISRISDFSISFKLSNKAKVLLRSMVGKRVTRNFLLEEGCDPQIDYE